MEFLEVLENFTGEAIDFLNDFDFVEGNFNPDHRVAARWENFHRVTERVKHALLEVRRTPPILDIR